eukprot:476325-Heterocapsa_arctica.AAC.1
MTKENAAAGRTGTPPLLRTLRRMGIGTQGTRTQGTAARPARPQAGRARAWNMRRIDSRAG